MVDDLKKQMAGLAGENDSLRASLAAVRTSHSKAVKELERRQVEEIAELQAKLQEAEGKVAMLEQSKRRQGKTPEWGGAEGAGFSEFEFE